MWCWLTGFPNLASGFATLPKKPILLHGNMCGQTWREKGKGKDNLQHDNLMFYDLLSDCPGVLGVQSFRSGAHGSKMTSPKLYVSAHNSQPLRASVLMRASCFGGWAIDAKHNGTYLVGSLKTLSVVVGAVDPTTTFVSGFDSSGKESIATFSLRLKTIARTLFLLLGFSRSVIVQSSKLWYQPFRF